MCLNCYDITKGEGKKESRILVARMYGFSFSVPNANGILRRRRRKSSSKWRRKGSQKKNFHGTREQEQDWINRLLVPVCAPPVSIASLSERFKWKGGGGESGEGRDSHWRWSSRGVQCKLDIRSEQLGRPSGESVFRLWQGKTNSQRIGTEEC